MSSPENMINGILILMGFVFAGVSVYLINWARHTTPDGHHFGVAYFFAFLASILTVTYITHLPFAKGIGDVCVYPVQSLATRLVTGVWPTGAGPIRREVPLEAAKPLDFLQWDVADNEIRRTDKELPQGWRVVVTLESTKPGGIIVTTDKPYPVSSQVTKVWVFMDPNQSLQNGGYWRSAAVEYKKP